MKVFLTGATGFLGSHVAKELHRRGHSLITLARSTSQTDHLSEMGAEIIWGSLPDPGPLSQVLSKVDAVIHIAGAIKALSKKDFLTINSHGTARLVDEIRKASPTPKHSCKYLRSPLVIPRREMTTAYLQKITVPSVIMGKVSGKVS